ncbi:hypothetical protein FRC01_011636, partial [Tulasnella sp. 417]
HIVSFLMSDQNSDSNNNPPPETPHDASAPEGTETNPTPLQEHQRSAVMSDLDQLWAAVGGGSPADTSGTSAAAPSAPATSPGNVQGSPSGVATSLTQSDSPSPPGASASSHSERPPRARVQKLGPGQHLFQLQPASTAITSSGSLIHSPSPGAYRGAYKSSSALRPWEIHCKCTNRTKKPQRHWKYHCPDNDEIEDLECELCGQKVGRPDYLARHREQSCPGSREGDAEDDEEDEGGEEAS